MSAEVLNSDGQFRALSDAEVYSVIMTEFLAGGGDGYHVISENKIRQLQGPLDTDILKEYLKKVSPIQSQVEDRIRFLNIKNRSFLSSSSNSHQQTLNISVTVLILTLLLDYIFYAETRS